MPLGDGESASRGDIGRFIRKISEERGLDLSQYRVRYVERRLAARLRAVGISTYTRYARYLDEHPEEFAKLLDTLTINVTEFFRDRPVYDSFERRVVPDLLADKARRRQRMIRAWSAGCSTGEEPYSIVMTLLKVMGEDASQYLLSVLGTDIDENALTKARIAEYPIDRLSGIPTSYQEKYIDKSVDRFRIRPEVTKHVRFKYLNLFDGEPINVVDIIFCRNVFIYFTREQQEKVMARFWSTLHRGGYLVLGRSEKLAAGVTDRLELVDGGLRIYRKP